MSFASEARYRFKPKSLQVLKERIIKQFSKIKENPKIGKPMRFARKGTREVYIGSFRLSYAYLKKENKIIYLYHKDE